MGWLHLRNRDSSILNDVLAEIDRDSSDRAAAVVAGAFVEEHLLILLKSRIQHDDKGDVAATMFQINGPLGAFGPKINLGFFLGLYSDRARKELYAIQTIRNDFAHKLEVNHFDIPSIHDRCRNLTLWKDIKVKVRPLPDESGKPVLDFAIGPTLDDNEQELEIADLFATGGTATTRHQYVTACKFFIGTFAIMSELPKAPASFLF